MASTLTHDATCICVPCMAEDMQAHVTDTYGADAWARAAGDAPMSITPERTRYATPGQRCGNGVVRKVSERQVRFIRSLMSSRDTTRLVRLPGSEDIENMSLTGARDLIDRLLGCPLRAGAPPVNLASEAQRRFVQSLLTDRAYDGPAIEVDTLTAREASAHITTLKALPYRPREARTAPSATALTIGMYRADDGTVVRVQKARTGTHLYGKTLDRDAGDAWVYAPGATRGLTEAHRMTIDDVTELSLSLGCCCCCGRTLTATVDGVGPAARVIGPICAAKYGYA